MIKAVLFDVGNVIIRWHPLNLYNRFIPDPRRRQFFLDTVCTLSWHLAHDQGVSFADNRQNLLIAYPDFTTEIIAFDTHFEEMLGELIAPTIEVLDLLFAKGIPLYALTNMPSEKASMVFSKSHVFSYFKDIIVSGDEGLVKPDPAIYNLTLRRLNLTAKEVFFTDDSKANIDMAHALGFKTHLFDKDDTLKAALVGARLL
jgi:2-haloacid dehalogenase